MSELHPPLETAPPRLSWFSDRRRQGVDRASARVHDRLLAQVGQGETPSARTGSGMALLVFAAVVVLAFLAAVVLLAVATAAPKNLWGWVGVVLGWTVVAALAPRPYGLAARPLPPDEFPQMHAFVGEVAAAVGVSAPGVIAVTTDFNAAVTSTGWRQRPALVIGLPMWTMLTDDERVALLGHELGHLRGRDTWVGLLVDQAHGILTRFATLLTPLPADSYSDFSRHHPTFGSSEATMNAAGSMLLHVVSAPAIGVLLSFERLSAVANQRREYLADLRAVDIAGSAGSARLMLTLTNVPGLHTLAGSAARRREDPFIALEQVRHRPDPTQAQVTATRVRARQQDLRWDDSHPRDDLRLALIEARPTERTLPVTVAERGADRELAGLRAELTRELVDELIETSY